MDWIYDKNITTADFEGFVYLITNTKTGQMYVGKKSVWTYKNGKRLKESSWRNYWSSSALVKAAVQEHGKENFKREILHWHKTKKDLGFYEVEEQFKREVLRAKTNTGEPLYYNRNIMSRFFCNFEERQPHTEETKLKMSIAAKKVVRKPMTQATKDKMSASHKGKTKSEEHRANLAASRRGIKRPRGPMTEEKRIERLIKLRAKREGNKL